MDRRRRRAQDPADGGFVFQNFNLLGSLTAEQNVAMPLRLAGARPVSVSLRQMTGFSVFSVPWAVLGVLAALAAVVVGTTAVATTLAATRGAPVREQADRG